MTVLMCASAHGHIKVVKLLIAAGARLKMKDADVNEESYQMIKY